MASSHVLLQVGDDPFNAKFEDLDGRLAFTIAEVERTPNVLVQLRREAPWALQHREIMGPGAAFFYFGPANRPGYIVFGNASSQAMTSVLRKKSRSSSSMYFTSQSGRELKWKVAQDRMECFDGNKTLAVYEPNQPAQDYDAILTIKHPGLCFVTEIVTMLMLSRMGRTLNW